MFEILAWKKDEWDFVGRRRIAFAFSGVLMLIGAVAIVQTVRGKAPMGIDFAGGLSMNVVLEKPVDVDRLRQVFGAVGIKEAQIQQAEIATGQRLLIRLREPGQEPAVRKALEETSGGSAITIEGIQEVGPAVGRKLQAQAAWAVFWAIVLIMVYIWARFEYRFGFAAAIATIHDVVAIVGIMWLMQKDFTMMTVSALLTLAGYSLSDTVVVYDRIRENMRLRVRDSLASTINKSINDVLSRTSLTGVTSLFTLVALLVYGSLVTFDFALALSLGVLIGTYSSWFVASPIIIEWEDYRRKRASEAALSHRR
jgi:preprotein translocase subunit SecF